MSSPRVTIGMVVRNGERYIAQAIDSFLVQTFGEFMLVVHDNASTDHTRSIVADIAQRDCRVQIVCKSRDVGVVRNLVDAADAAATPLFCWAASDDLREPTFLERMVAALDKHADASLACCAVRNIDPDGTQRDIRSETASLRTLTRISVSQRLRMYLKAMPGTPFYGLFRTADLKASLDVLREMDVLAGDGPPLLGLDLIFLARFLRDFDIAYEPEPLLLFRRGGISHNIGRFGTLTAYRRQVSHFNSQLRRATTIDRPFLSRQRLGVARRAAVVRWLLGHEMRRMSAHYVMAALPGARTLQSRTAVVLDPALRRLRSRLDHHAPRPRIVLFGAGKHTRRRLQDLHTAIRNRGDIIAACDDHHAQCAPIPGLSIEPTRALDALRPDIVLVSSDTYERAMYRRARAVATACAAVWCLYDLAIEQSAGEDSDESTPAIKADISARQSPVAATR